MKRVALILLFIFHVACLLSQAKQGAVKPIASKPVQKKYNPAKIQAGLVNKLLHDTCLDKKFSIVFYLPQDSSGHVLTSQSTPVIQARLNEAITVLNTAFSNICVSFEYCKLVVIPDYNYNQWKPNGNGQVAINNYYMENTLGIFLPEEILSPLPDVPEYSYVYTTPRVGVDSHVVVNALVIQINKLLDVTSTGFKGHSLLHSMGRFFGLPHTFDEINPAGAGTVTPLPPMNAAPAVTTLEHVNRANLQNCLDHGDGFCDTDADPYPSVLTPQTYIPVMFNCLSSKGLKDGNGDFYLPPCDNLMSHYVSIRCRFSQQQYNYMAYFIMTRRMYLH